MEELLNSVLGGIDNEEKETKKKLGDTKSSKTLTEDKQVKVEDKESSNKEDPKEVKPWQWTPEPNGSRYSNQGFKRYPDRSGYTGSGYGGGYQRYQPYNKPFNRGFGRGGGGGGYRNDYKPYQGYQGSNGGGYQGYSQNGTQNQGYGNGYRKSY